MVARWDGTFYMNTEMGWAPWDGALSSLEALKRVTATTENERNVVQVPLGLAGEFDIFMGYQPLEPNSSGEINLTYNIEPIKFTIQENITGNWVGSVKSEVNYPECPATMDISFTQEGNSITGFGMTDVQNPQSMSKCEQPQSSFELSGLIDGSIVFFTVRTGDYILNYAGDISDTHRKITGTYVIPMLDEKGSWELELKK